MRFWEKKRTTYFFLCIVIFTLFGILFFGVLCPDKVCALTGGNPTPKYTEIIIEDELDKKELKYRADVPKRFDEDVLRRDYEFDIEGNRVIVFLHIQKTGGTTMGR